jgi:hypothetical protein
MCIFRERSCEDCLRNWASANPRERPQERLILLHLGLGGAASKTVRKLTYIV